MLEHLLPNVLQRTHPVPIGSQTIKAETHPACGLVVNVKTFVNLVRINGWSQSIGPANEEHSTDHSDHDDQAQGDSLQAFRSEEHTSELQSQSNLVCRLLLEK